MIFLFTAEGFCPDISGLSTEEEREEAKRWTGEDGYRALYQLGLQGRQGESPRRKASFTR